MEILKHRFSNALSYPNSETEIDFTRLSGIVFIRGENGSGKTNFISLMDQALFGKTKRFTKSQLVNHINQGNFFNSIDVKTDDGKIITISRGIRPDIIKLEGIDEQKYSKPQVDKYIEEEIVGMQQELFLNTILISASEFKSFVDMKTADKTKIIDQLFGTDKLSSQLAVTKKQIKLHSDEIKTLDILIADKIKKQEELNARIAEIKVANPDDISNKIDGLTIANEKLVIEISALEKTIKTSKDNITALSDEKSRLEKLRNDTIFTLTQSKNNKSIELNKELNKQCSDVEKLLNDENLIANNLLKEKYDVDIELISSSANKKAEEHKAAFEAVKAEVLENFKNKLSEITTTKDSDIATQTALYDNAVIDENKKFDDAELAYNNEIASIKNELSKSETILTEKKALRYELNLNVSKTKEKIALYEKGKCETCTVDLHSNEYHIARKGELEKDLIVLEADLSKVKLECEKLDKDIASYKQDIENKNNALRKLDFELQTKLTSLKTSLNTEIAKINQLFKDSETGLKNVSRDKVDNAKSIYENDVKLISDSVNQSKQELFSEYTKQKDANDSKTRTNILLRQEELRSLSSAKINKEIDAIEIDIKNQSIVFDKDCNDASVKLDNTKLYHEQLISDLSNLKSNLQLNNSHIEIYKESQKDNNIVVELTNMVATLEYEIKESYDKQDELKDKYETANILSVILGESGVRQEYLKRILPMFNTTINDICTRLQFKYRLIFDENFDVKMTWCGDKFDSKPSAGQESVINLMIILATIQMILMRKGNCNVMFIDELFSHVDQAMIEKIVELLSEFAKTYNITLFIVSHTPIPMAHVNHIINVEFVDNFSKMTVNY